MTTHELYINDVLIDLDKDVNIYLLYQSMLFTDLQSVVSNRSYNISLPKSANNLRAIQHYNLADRDDPSGDSLTFPRKYHKVRYYRNGITIFERGAGTFLGVDSRINFVFAWGNAESFQVLFDKKLTELTNIADAHIGWNELTQYFDMPFHEEFSYGFLDVDFGQGSQIKYQHPCVRSEYILDAIARQNGIHLKLSEGETGDGYDSHGLRDFVIPLTTKMGDKQSLDAQGLNATLVEYTYSVREYSYTNLNPSLNLLTDPMGFWDNNNKVFTRSKANTTKVRLIIEPFSVRGSSGQWATRPQYSFNGLGLGSFSDRNVDGIRYIDYDAVDAVVDITDSDFTYSGVRRNVILVQVAPSAEFKLLTAPKVTLLPLNGELTYPTVFPIQLNLPGITQADFIKGLMQVAGVFAYIKSEREIGFISIDDIVAKKNTPKTNDWTAKLLNVATTFNAPEGVEFKMDNFAQRNICKWDDGDDDALKGKYDGVMVVRNETIERERESFKLPFAPTANIEYVLGEYKTQIAKIPVYTTDSDGKIEYNDDISPRILRPKDVNGHLGASFEGMSMETLIRENYKGYQEVIQTPRVIKVRCLLSDYDLSQIDLTAPVYFEQYGNHYAILKVQAAADGVCKCEFLEI